MFAPSVVVTVLCLYIGLLFIVALWVERGSPLSRRLAHSPAVYSLSLAVYCTSWTFYGSVGKAAGSGLMFLAIYLGPTIAIGTWWFVLRKLVRVKSSQRITSIADFISARYGKSRAIAALAACIALIGITPYIALQLKAIISTFTILTIAGHSASWIESNVGPLVVGLMALFTIMFGVRRLDPTERHEGMVTALALECLVKLAAFLAAGVFVTYILYDGFGDIFNRLSQSTYSGLFAGADNDASTYLTWGSLLLLSMSAILFLPRQFHVAVVENSNENHIKTAIWLFPLYMLLINIFVMPIAAGGLLQGLPLQKADTFVLGLPLDSGHPILAMFVFLGGFSAATGMIIVSSMTMSTMAVNHLLIPVIESHRSLAFMKRHLLKARWASVVGILLTGYAFERVIGKSYTLVNIGIISFAAVLQFAPAMIGGLFWRRGSRAGAFAGMSAGFIIWFYTLLLPSFARSGWISSAFLDNGPLGIAFLRPEQLFGITVFSPLANTVFWTIIVNTGLYCAGSLWFASGKEDQRISDLFVDALSDAGRTISGISCRAHIELEGKVQIIRDLFHEYFSDTETEQMLARCLKESGITDRTIVSIADLASFNNEAEQILAGSTGAATAHHAMKQTDIFTPEEAEELAGVYGGILAELKISPEELRERINYYQERENLLSRHSHELEHQVSERTHELRAANDIGKAITSILNPHELMQKVVALICRHFDLAYAAIYINDEEGRYAELKAEAGQPESNENSIRLGDGPVGTTIETGLPHCTDGDDCECRAANKDMEGYICSRLIIPLRASGENIGALNIRRKESGQFHRDLVTVLHTLSDQIAISLVNTRLYRKLEQELIEKTRAQASLAESEDFFRSVTETAKEAIISADDKGMIIYWNRGAENLFGHTAGEIIGQPITALIDEQYRDMHDRGFRNFMSGGSEKITGETVEIEGRRKDKSSFPIELSLASWHKQGRKYITAIIRDITERRENEARIKQSQATILQQEKMASIGQLAAGVAHEINNPTGFVTSNLGTLNTYVNKLTDYMSLQARAIKDASNGSITEDLEQERKKLKIDYVLDDIHDLVNESLDGTERIAKIVRNLKSFARVDESDHKEADINECIESTLNIVWNELKYKAEIKKELGDIPFIKCYPQQLNQVFMNILVNASHAIEDKGEISIRTCQEGKSIKIAISDTGSGIPEDKLPRIFEPFFTTKPVGKGTGLGLSITYDIIKKHNGDLKVDSQVGLGTTFTIILPVVADTQNTSRYPEATDTQPPLSSLT